MNLSFVFLMMSEGKDGGMSSIIFLVLIFGVFWLFMIRPQMKKQKDQQKFKETISKGDKVITIGGIHGKILEVADTTFVIEVEGGNRLKIEKSAISMESTQALNKEKK
jgi:preprotein translocase subunit YajC